MGTLKLKCRIVHVPGLWGNSEPVVGAKVEIIDVDAPGRGDDVIFTATTDGNGRFQGISSEWQDRIKIRIPNPTLKNPLGYTEKEIPDETDVLMLRAHITYDCQGSGLKETNLPYVFINDNTESPPMVVPWGPCKKTPYAKINGYECKSTDEIFNRFKQEVDSGKSNIKIVVYGDDAIRLKDVADAEKRASKWYIPAPPTVPFPPLIPESVLICYVIAYSTAGASITLSIVTLCLIYALHKGYTKIKPKFEADNMTGIARFEIEIEK